MTILTVRSEDGSEGRVLDLKTVRLGPEDYGFRAIFIHKGQPFIVAKHIQKRKPTTRDEAMDLLQGLINFRQDLIEPYRQGMRVEYR